MGHLGISGAIVPTASQKESGPGTGSLRIILKMVSPFQQTYLCI